MDFVKTPIVLDDGRIQIANMLYHRPLFLEFARQQLRKIDELLEKADTKKSGTLLQTKAVFGLFFLEDWEKAELAVESLRAEAQRANLLAHLNVEGRTFERR